jgi:hypothetical protein
MVVVVAVQFLQGCGVHFFYASSDGSWEAGTEDTHVDDKVRLQRFSCRG